MFAGIWTALGLEKKYWEGNKYYFKYKTKELSLLEHLTGKDLKVLLKTRWKDYALDFQSSILENASEESIIIRDVHWKEVLKTREFRLNKN